MSIEEIPFVRKHSQTTASRLKQERERRGWTQSQLAEQVNTTQTNVSRWEKGETVPGPYYRQRLGALFGKTLTELGFVSQIEVENSESDAQSKQITQAVASSTFQAQKIWNVPYRRNPFFTGREEILAHLHATLTKNKTAALTQAQAISGLGGIGKTQIALEYAYRYHEDYDALLWLSAPSRDTLIADFLALASLLRLPEQGEQDQDIVISAVKRWLTTHDNWLLIVDNVDDPKAVTDILPIRTKGKVLLTTRLQALGALAQSVEVEKMEMSEGIFFLLRRSKALVPDAILDEISVEEQAQVAEIVAVLDGLPLALDQAGAYIEETQCGFLGYLDLYRQHRKELLQRRSTSLLVPDHPESVTTTWSLSFQRVEKSNTTAAALLQLFAFLHPDAIPEEMITLSADDPLLGPIASNAMETNSALGTLLRYSLIRRNTEEKLLSIHRLVQAVLKDSMSIEQQRLWAERAIHTISRAFPSVELKTWNQCRRCLPHAQTSLAYIDDYDLAFPAAAHLFNEVAIYLTIHAQYAQAETFLQQALAIRQRILPPAHPDMALTLNDLGALYLTQGKYQQSEPLLLEARNIREQELGLEHPDTATSLHNLGVLFCALGKYELAEDFYQRAFQIRQRAFETNHPDRALSLIHLAGLYAFQGKYGQAEAFYLQALAIQKQVLGLNHPDVVAKTLNDLALVYRHKGNYKQAEFLYSQALSTQERVLGSSHPDVAKTLNGLGRLYRAQGEYTKAEPCYLSALDIRMNFFGDVHPTVAQSYYSLAKLYLAQGKYPLAEEHCQQAFYIQEQQLGSDHPDIADTLGILAKIYQVQENYTKAELLYQRALLLRESTTGSTHPHVAFIISSLSEVYQAQGKYQEAEPLIRRSLEIRTRSLGAGHPYIAYNLSNLAENSYLQGDYVRAEQYFKEALTIREQMLGSAHPQTASAYYNLAKLASAQGQYEEAEALFQKALTIREQSLGPEHPDVATSLVAYAQLLHTVHRGKLALQLEARAQAIRANHANPSG